MALNILGLCIIHAAFVNSKCVSHVLGRAIVTQRERESVEQTQTHRIQNEKEKKWKGNRCRMACDR